MSLNSSVIGINHPFSNFIENGKQIANVPVAARYVIRINLLGGQFSEPHGPERPQFIFSHGFCKAYVSHQNCINNMNQQEFLSFDPSLAADFLLTHAVCILYTSQPFSRIDRVLDEPGTALLCPSRRGPLRPQFCGPRLIA